MSSDVPLLNSYKKSFVYHRICQTLFAGIRRCKPHNDSVSRCRTWCLNSIEFVLFFLPGAVALPFVIVNSSDNEVHWPWIAGYGTLICCYSAVVQLSAKYCGSTPTSNNELESEGKHSGESLFPNICGLPLLLFFRLKWEGYLAVAGLNLPAQISDRISPFGV